jgi:hypothetical protein
MTGSFGPAGKLGSQGPATEESAPHSPEQDRRPPTNARHLYIVHSADPPQAHPMIGTRFAGHYRSSQGMLDRSIQAQIGRMLRDVFTDVSKEPVPERFVKLLQALETKEKQA